MGDVFVFFGYQEFCDFLVVFEIVGSDLVQLVIVLIVVEQYNWDVGCCVFGGKCVGYGDGGCDDVINLIVEKFVYDFVDFGIIV